MSGRRGLATWRGPPAALLTSPLMRRSGLPPRALLALLALVAIAGVVALRTIGGSSASPRAGGKQIASGEFRSAGVLSPPRSAPALALNNYLGQPIKIDAYRGKAVLLTFLYTNCPDVCPLITSNLRVAQNVMGPAVAAKAQVIAVSVDPRGDTPKAVAAFLASTAVTGRSTNLMR